MSGYLWTSVKLTSVDLLTGEDDEEDDSDVDKEELEVSQVTEDLTRLEVSYCIHQRVISIE